MNKLNTFLLPLLLVLTASLSAMEVGENQLIAEEQSKQEAIAAGFGMTLEQYIEVKSRQENYNTIYGIKDDNLMAFVAATIPLAIQNIFSSALEEAPSLGDAIETKEIAFGSNGVVVDPSSDQGLKLIEKLKSIKFIAKGSGYYLDVTVLTENKTIKPTINKPWYKKYAPHILGGTALCAVGSLLTLGLVKYFR